MPDSTKRTILSVLIVSLLSPGSFAEPNLRKAVQRQIDAFAQAKNDRKPVVYPELAQRVEAMFLRYPAAHIAIAGLSPTGHKLITDIYVHGEEIYVMAAPDGWNLVANNSGVFEWERGRKDGIKIKRDDDELVAYLYYLTDVSWIMASIYYTYLTAPDRFDVVRNEQKKWTELRLKNPPYGLEAIYVSEKPLWFHGMRIQDPEGHGPQEVMISNPEPTNGPPASFLKEFNTIRFENSELKLQRHMTFL